MSDYFLGLALSSLIAMLLGIKKAWRLSNKGGLSNSLLLLLTFFISVIIFGALENGTSNAVLGLMGILTIPSYLIVKSKAQSDNKVKNLTINTKSSNGITIVTTDSSEKSKKSPVETDSSLSLPKELEKTSSRRQQLGWYISISFGKSSSQNFPQALEMAKRAPQFLENNVEGKVLYQAIYSSKPNEYLNFISLYELIRDWKSCFVIINDQLVDRKIIGGLNYCYGDKCRSGNPEFCYGASYMTENPFGCHRIQISACNHPWWTFGEFDTRSYWHVDKKTMLKRMIEYSEPYRLCPAFSWEKAMDGLNSLPDKIKLGTKSDWIRQGDVLVPKLNPNQLSFSINIELPDDLQ